MKQRIVYTRPDGGISVVIPTGDLVIEEVLAKDIPADAINPTVCEASEIPDDRTFRDAWKHDASGVSVDMPKARIIHMGRIRVARDVELKRQDIEQLKGNDVAARKQALRDLPQTFDLTPAATPAELKALWPSGLPK